LFDKVFFAIIFVGMDKQLKRKITNCWNILTNDQTETPFAITHSDKARAFYQLEYILIGAGLLARHRERRGAPMLQPEFGELG
jgi:hypothetical protein